MSDTFSVIMPADNVERFIAPALRSLLRERGVDLDIIVVDDGSTDPTGVFILRLLEGYVPREVEPEPGFLDRRRTTNMPNDVPLICARGGSTAIGALLGGKSRSEESFRNG